MPLFIFLFMSKKAWKHMNSKITGSVLISFIGNRSFSPVQNLRDYSVFIKLNRNPKYIVIS